VWFDIARPCLDLYLLNVFFSYPCDFWRYRVIFWYFFSRFRHSEVVAMILAPYILYLMSLLTIRGHWNVTIFFTIAAAYIAPICNISIEMVRGDSI
jgi:hypothetical protein